MTHTHTLIILSVSTKELDPDKRPGLREEAISVLQKLIELDPESIETLYQLALECAITRDIGLTISTIKKALRIDDKNIPCWHLLALSFSAQKDIQSALTACELGVKDSDWETTDSPAEVLIAAGNDDGEEFFSFKMTQNALQELVNGPDAALQNRESLFTLYGRVFPDGAHDSIRRRDVNEDINPSMRPPGGTRSTRAIIEWYYVRSSIKKLQKLSNQHRLIFDQKTFFILRTPKWMHRLTTISN